MSDPTIDARDLILGTLRADPALLSLCPRVYPSKAPANPVWPFIRLGPLTNIPARNGCGTGGEVSGAVHCFAKVATGALDPELKVAQINRRVLEVLESLPNTFTTQTNVLPDPEEADAYHGIANFVSSFAA